MAGPVLRRYGKREREDVCSGAVGTAKILERLAQISRRSNARPCRVSAEVDEVGEVPCDERQHVGGRGARELQKVWIDFYLPRDVAPCKDPLGAAEHLELGSLDVHLDERDLVEVDVQCADPRVKCGHRN